MQYPICIFHFRWVHQNLQPLLESVFWMCLQSSVAKLWMSMQGWVWRRWKLMRWNSRYGNIQLDRKDKLFLTIRKSIRWRKQLIHFVGDVYCWECTGKFCDTVDDIRHTRRRCDVGSSACQMFITGMKAEIR